MSSFVEELVSGGALLDDFDKYVEEWHTAPADSPASELELHEFLGMTWDEYRLCVEHRESLRFIVAAHKADKPVAAVLDETANLTLAARSEDRVEALRLFQWLQARGRISDAP